MLFAEASVIFPMANKTIFVCFLLEWKQYLGETLHVSSLGCFSTNNFDDIKASGASGPLHLCFDTKSSTCTTLLSASKKCPDTCWLGNWIFCGRINHLILSPKSPLATFLVGKERSQTPVLSVSDYSAEFSSSTTAAWCGYSSAGLRFTSAKPICKQFSISWAV